jgi:methionyl-tRNA formyltransferase
MRVGFAGTPPFAATALAAILDAGFDVPLVLTQPDRPRGRGLKLEPSPVKSLATARGLPVLQPATLKTDEARAPVLAVAVDVLVVAAYGLILPPAILDWPRHGCINVHASLLPRWRGAAPIQRAIMAGDSETGITLMQMDAGLDTGPMIEWTRVDIGPRESAGALHDRLAVAGAQLLATVLARLDRDGRLAATPQPTVGATYAAKIVRADAEIAWSATGSAIDRQIRALDPVPGASTLLGGESWKIWRAEPKPGPTSAAPGTVAVAGPAGIEVACGDSRLRILELQPAGGRRMRAADVVAGRRLAVGMRFVTPG